MSRRNQLKQIYLMNLCFMDIIKNLEEMVK